MMTSVSTLAPKRWTFPFEVLMDSSWSCERREATSGTPWGKFGNFSALCAANVPNFSGDVPGASYQRSDRLGVGDPAGDRRGSGDRTVRQPHVGVPVSRPA